MFVPRIPVPHLRFDMLPTLPVVADLILERLEELMAPFRQPEYAHDPATTDNFLRGFFDVVRLAPPNEHTVFERAARDLVNTLGDLPEDVRPSTNVLDTFMLAYAEFTLGREVGYARRWADILSGYAGRESGALRLLQEDVANGILDERSPVMRAASRVAEKTNREYKEAEDKYAVLLEQCKLVLESSVYVDIDYRLHARRRQGC